MMRYFYTDPLAAAWMAKHFGMRFVWVDHTGREPGELPLVFNDLISEVTNRFVRQFLIHPDSLHLLVPQPGDTVQIADRIIQRNSIPFHWPDREP